MNNSTFSQLPPKVPLYSFSPNQTIIKNYSHKDLLAIFYTLIGVFLIFLIRYILIQKILNDIKLFSKRSLLKNDKKSSFVSVKVEEEIDNEKEFNL